MDIKSGDAVCVTMLPSRDIYGKEYTETGGGGIVLQAKEHSTIIKLFDGPIIEAEGTEFDEYSKKARAFSEAYIK